MSYEGRSDFRSDTVTRPTAAMMEAIRTARVGDDVLGDDPTVIELQDFAADLFGREAALFCPSGTMANQIALRVLTDRDAEVIVEATTHAFFYEQGGLAQLSGIQARTIPGDRGRLALDAVARAIRPDNEHFPVTQVLVLENTHNSSGGSVLPIDYLREAYAFAKGRRLSVHLDGARICNASAASGVSLADYGACADTISCCLSKGLGAPVGTVLVGDRTVIARARRVRKVFGGGMRQSGLLAAAGLVALRDMRARLVDDHRRVADLARGFRSVGAEVAEPETNMIYLDVPGRAAEVAERLAADDVHAIPLGPDQIRFVTHYDVDDGDVTRAVAALGRALR